MEDKLRVGVVKRDVSGAGVRRGKCCEGRLILAPLHVAPHNVTQTRDVDTLTHPVQGTGQLPHAHMSMHTESCKVQGRLGNL